MTTGMEGYAQQAGQLDQQSQGLRVAVDSGQLVMDPESAERVAKLYDDKADEIAIERSSADRLVARGAYGDCKIGRALEQKMADKVHHPEAGLFAILGKMEENLRKIAQAFRDSAKTTQNADDEGARDVKRNM